MKPVSKVAGRATTDAGTYKPLSRMCEAFGCPEPGSISPSNSGQASDTSWFCRFHFNEQADRWPEITRQRRIAHDSAPQRNEPANTPVTAGYVAKVRAEMRDFCRSFGAGGRDHRAWARKLRDREAAGEHLSDAQSKAWRYAMRFQRDEKGEAIA